MLKFFRRIRRKLIDEGNLKRYLLYAIGEILLVVIGILIALQINNWNNQKQQLKKELTFLEELEKSLSFDLENEINAAIEATEEDIHAFELYKSGLNNYPNVVSSDSIQTLVRRFMVPWGLEINKAPFDNLISTGIDLISNDSLRTQISQFYGYEIPWVVDHNINNQNWNDINIYPIFHNNFNLYGTWTRSQIEFLKTDMPTINRFETYNRFFMRGFIWRLEEVKPKMEALLKNIKKEINHLNRAY